MKTLLVILAAMCLVGCRFPKRLQIEADRATYEAIAPEYREYVKTDESLDAEEKARRYRTLDTWEMRIRAAEDTLR